MSPETANSLLVRVAEKRDEAAFNDLYVHFAPLIKKFLMREGAEAALAEDVAQQAMENIWRKAPMFQSDKGNASAWIYRIARNLRNQINIHYFGDFLRPSGHTKNDLSNHTVGDPEKPPYA